MRVLKNLAPGVETLARISPDSEQGSCVVRGFKTQDLYPSLPSMPLDRNRRRRMRFSLLSGDPSTPSFDAPYSGGDGGICPPWLSESEFNPSQGGCSSELLAAAGGPGNPRMGVLQDPTQANTTLTRLLPDSA